MVHGISYYSVWDDITILTETSMFGQHTNHSLIKTLGNGLLSFSCLSEDSSERIPGGGLNLARASKIIRAIL